MVYSKYPLMSEVLYRSKPAVVVGITHGHKDSISAGNRYEVSLCGHNFVYRDIPERHLQPMPVEEITMVAANGYAMPVRHPTGPRLVVCKP